MKGLLKLFSIISLGTTPVMSVVACGGSAIPATPTDDEGDNIQDLLSKAQNKIREEFGSLIDKEKNLFKENQFAQGNEFYNILKNMPSMQEERITNDDFIATFIREMQNNINNLVASELIKDTELRLLFNGIRPNDILKINTNNSKIFKVPFKWEAEKVDFGIHNYSPRDYGITYWYNIKMDLNLELSYKNKENQIEKKDLQQDYLAYFANSDANISGIIEAASLRLNNKLKDQLVKIQLVKDNDNNDQARITQVKTYISNVIGNPALKVQGAEFVNTTQITSLFKTKAGYSIYSEAEQFYNAFSKPLVSSKQFLIDYFQNQVLKNFNQKLNEWTESSSLSTSEKEKVNAFGTINLSDWTISGLSLKPIKLNFVNIRTDQIQTQWVEFMSNALGGIFSKGGFIKEQFDIINDDKNLVMYMNRSDFDTYVADNRTLYDVSTYFDEKIKQKSVAERVISKDTNFRIYLNGSINFSATLNNAKFVKRVDDSTLSVDHKELYGYSYLDITLDHFRFCLGSHKMDTKGHVSFKNWIIKRADSTIWN